MLGGGTARRFVALGAVLVLGAAAHAVHRGMPSEPRAALGEDFIPKPRFAKSVALGFDGALADYYWLQAVQLVGGTLGDPTQHATTVGRLVDVITTLNPHVGHPYRFAAIWMTDTRDNVEKANRLLERGVAHHPHDWRQYFYLGFNHFYHLGDNEAAADWLARASAIDGAPSYLPRLVAKLRSTEGGLDAARAFLGELARQAEDPAEREHYERGLVEIETERRARFLDRARAEYRRRHGSDIEQVDDLVRGPHAVLARLPEEPNGKRWLVDDKGRLVSSFYMRRYEVHRMGPSAVPGARGLHSGGSLGEPKSRTGRQL